MFIKQLKQIENNKTSFRSLSGDMMTGFVQAAVVGAEVEGAQAISLFLVKQSVFSYLKWRPSV